MGRVTSRGAVALLAAGALLFTACDGDDEGSLASVIEAADPGAGGGGDTGDPGGGDTGDPGGGGDTGDPSGGDPGDPGGGADPGDPGGGETGDPGGGGDPGDPGADDGETGDDGGLTSDQWLLIILIGLVVIAIIAAIAAMSSRRSASAPTVATASTAQRRLDDLLRSARILHDTSVMGVLSSDVSMLPTTWAATRSQLIDLEGRIGQLATEMSGRVDTRPLDELIVAVTGVRGTLEANVNLRTQPDREGRADLLAASNQDVLTRNNQLSAAIQQASYLRL